MRLNAPKKVTFIIAIILIVLGIIFELAGILGAVPFWILTAGAILLALGCFVKGL